METGAFNQTVMSGKDYENWVSREEARHVALMKKAGFIAGK
jgi:putative tricarboxylic transport membrane protein